MTEMEYRQLGDSGLTVSVVGLGCNNFGGRIGADQADAVVNAAVDAGITLFDTADVYGDRGGSEEILGASLGKRRDEVLIATKFGGDMKGVNGPDWGVRGSRRYIRKAVESSLRRLGTDWIDLYQLHVPDPITPIEETLAALSELVADGKVRYIGSSQFAGWQVVDADWAARTAGLEHFVSAQNKYSLLDREIEDEVVPACEHLGIGIVTYSPLAGGLLTGKYQRGEAAPEGTRLATQPERLARADFDKIEALDTFAAERDVTLLDVAIGGLAAQPAVGSVIAGATTPEQIAQNVAAGQWEPTTEDLAILDELTLT
ncbi:aryl-alcohol dehydrogenase-like predicted oxidoreductase [Kribbella sp. VKM Ac-2527]|uniref:Aryl-alcohol dehydrogenase-like predicted oxidoreductase n=1 Tax=Kribbella caucasensis TaxID=2512215 RepID=A0A4R6K548_9ACTN|nr:aldo/keto reductase [Kribbella sp. VKM Ac-2527]TDO44379.1 aryl-alcohol dehydrogenase-like predicted oxidoreductase [Kribbella sp. VKM Ac-2527]